MKIKFEDMNGLDENSVVKKELVEKLKTISQDREFILSVINHAKHIDDRRAIIDYIDTGEDVTYENLILISITLGRERK